MDGNQEVPITKEIFSTAKQTVALQTRLVLGGEALNPNKLDLAKVTNDSLQDISQETYKKLNTASTNERTDYWQKKSIEDPSLNSYENQMKSWTSDVVKFMNEEGFKEENALVLYDLYFAGEGKVSGIDKFVEDIIAGHTQDGNLNFEQLTQKLPRIKKLANVFGGNSSEFVEASILTKTKLKDAAKKQELIEQANEESATAQTPQTRLNYLNPDEERLLKWLEPNAQPILIDIKIDKPEITPINERTDQQLQEARQHQNELIAQKWREINKYPAREINLGKTQDGKDIKVNLGIPNLKDENEKDRLKKDGWALLEYPNTPFVYISNQLLIEKSQKTQSNLADVCVISAHGIRFQDGSWRFINGQSVYDTVSNFNKYAHLNNLPQIEFITACDNEAPNQMKIIGLDTGLGPIIQSHLKPTSGTITWNKKLGQIYTSISGNFQKPESLAGWKKEFKYEPVVQTQN